MISALTMNMVRRNVPYCLPDTAEEQGAYVSWWQKTGRHLDEYYATFNYAGKRFAISSSRFRRDGGPYEGIDARSARLEIAFAVAHSIESSLALADQI